MIDTLFKYNRLYLTLSNNMYTSLECKLTITARFETTSVVGRIL